MIPLIIQDQFYTIQNLQRSPIPQTSNWSETFFCSFLKQTGSSQTKLMQTLLISKTYLFFLFFSAPSGYFGHVKTKLHGRELSHFRQHCDLKVPSLMISNDKMTSDMWTESQASYRLVYELILPFLLPIILLGKK